MLTITVHRARGAGEPSGRSSTARRWFSNCEVTAPSWVQWPVLCGRIASSLTSTRPSLVSNSSTASTPVTSSAPAIRSAISCACPASAGARSGAGATTSWQMPSFWVEATTGYAAAWPLGERATSAESSRRKSTSSSASSRTPVRLGHRERLGAVVDRADEPDALAVVPAAGGLEHAREAERLDLGDRRRRSRCAGTGRRARRAARASRPCPGRAPAPPARAVRRCRRPRARAGARSGRARGRR